MRIHRRQVADRTETHSSSIRLLLPPLLAMLLLLSAAAGATTVEVESIQGLDSAVLVQPGLSFSTGSVALADVEDAEVQASWQDFSARFSSSEAPRVFLDRRTNRPALVVLSGIPWIPGSGNLLSEEDFASVQIDAKEGRTELAVLESVARAFIDENSTLLGATSDQFILDARSSGATGEVIRPDGTQQYRHWNVDFVWAPHGVKVRGGRLMFRVNSGNLVQFGMEQIGEAGDVPTASFLDANLATETLRGHLGLSKESENLQSAASLEAFPVVEEDDRMTFRLAWAYSFAADDELWEGAVDAVSGEVLFFRSTASSSCPSRGITGGVRTFGGGGQPGETVLPMPFADRNNQVYSDQNGCFSSPGSAVSQLKGQFFQASDTHCDGAVNSTCVRLEAPSGDLAFGTASPVGTSDCNSTTAQSHSQCFLFTDGGPGNTTAARTAYYYLSQALFAALDAPAGVYPNCDPNLISCWKRRREFRVNETSPACNALFTGLSFRFSQSSAGLCRNYGELESVIYHEYAHLLDRLADANGDSSDDGSGEAYSDIFSTLLTQDSCYGRNGAHQGVIACGAPFSYGCSSCDGTRELDWRKRTGANAGPRTPADNCTLCADGGSNPGPCGKQSHCESHVASGAFWDFAAVELPSHLAPGEDAWEVARELWFEASGNITSMFTCTCPSSGGGDSVGTLYSTLMAADDCDGNLLNGTPHAEAIFTALDRHGIAAGTASDPQNQNNDCSGSDLEASAGPGRSQSLVRTSMKNNGPSAEPGAVLVVSFTSIGNFTVTPMGLATSCNGPSNPGSPLNTSSYTCPSTALAVGGSVFYSWNVTDVSPSPVEVEVAVSGTLTDPVAANNGAVYVVQP